MELDSGEAYHESAIALNTGRNALEYIIRISGIAKIHLPYFICDVVLEPISKPGIEYSFYHIDEQLEPVDLPASLGADEAFLYPDYFGVKGRFAHSLKGKYPNLIIDASQSFFLEPVGEANTFYSARKFFGVPDGAYLYAKDDLRLELERDLSYDRMAHLVKRVAVSAEAGFDDFKRNEEALSNSPLKRMSRLTELLMKASRSSSVAKTRKNNFEYLHKNLKGRNSAIFALIGSEVPLSYPFWIADSGKLRSRLLEEQVYIPLYWPNVLEWSNSGDVEYALAEEVIHLPIDQRYGIKEMDHILSIIG